MKKLSLTRCLEGMLIGYMVVGLLTTATLAVVGLVSLIGG